MLLQCDGYRTYDALVALDRPDEPCQFANCWTDVRRRLVKRLESDD